MNNGVAGTVRPKSISFRSWRLLVEEEVPRADVAVDESGLVNGRDGLGGFADEMHAAARQAGIAGGQGGIQVWPFEKLHHQVRAPLGRKAEFQGLHDVRVFQLHRDLALGRFVETFGIGASKTAVFLASRIFRPTTVSVRRSRAM